MTCPHKHRTMVVVTLDMDAAMPDWLPIDAPEEPVTFVAYQCDECGEFLDASYTATVDELQRRDYPAIDYAAWDDAIRVRLNQTQPERTQAGAVQFFGAALRK